MSTEKLRGIVIRETPVGESDKIITLLTREAGKVTVSARGARNAKSKFLSSCQLFACSDFVIYTGRKNPSVAQAAVIDNFYALRNDIKAFAAASYLVDFSNRMIYEGEECGELLSLLLTALKRLERGDEPLFCSHIFELKFLGLSGMLPDFSVCHLCGKAAEHPAYLTHNGLVCEECNSDASAVSLLSGTVKALNYISKAEISKTFSFNVSYAVKAQLEALRPLLVEPQTELHFKTYDFLLSLCKDSLL